ncbi:FIG01114221: hypothetical protein [Streptococcus pyogenes]|nr:FIG01114221: hypothetical protein [Streptococcus pyogenes]SDV91883.1 FIG01114221: hypothetical protein [Streptococcus pyogenes]
MNIEVKEKIRFVFFINSLFSGAIILLCFNITLSKEIIINNFVDILADYQMKIET